MPEGFRPEAPRPRSLRAVLLGLAISLLIGTVLLLLDPKGFGGQYSLEIGALAGGIIVGGMLFQSTRRSIYMGVVEGLLSFMSYFLIVPMLMDAGLLPIEAPPQLPPEVYLAIIVTTLGLAAASGALGAYFGSALRRWTMPRIPPGPPPYPGAPGEPQPPTAERCPYCHANLPLGALYCPECGRRVR